MVRWSYRAQLDVFDWTASSKWNEHNQNIKTWSKLQESFHYFASSIQVNNFNVYPDYHAILNQNDQILIMIVNSLTIAMIYETWFHANLSEDVYLINFRYNFWFTNDCLVNNHLDMIEFNELAEAYWFWLQYIRNHLMQSMMIFSQLDQRTDRQMKWNEMKWNQTVSKIITIQIRFSEFSSGFRIQDSGFSMFHGNIFEILHVKFYWAALPFACSV
jgi:hypothetical protein